ncbi:MAG TPA: WecB/TagA/CpsF family glycosyltransferase [Phycisphaerae bacterium]|nr:WecB/TagA/CpsF family glycosyltransferase [Phycisphaerae bacterium]HRY70130.1 WecB/TagA/CpsF family glycosyltransferase [Phycisphaerae bacterium]HSA28270.1 WecB/TagA/CpsF family glycosyltransferase [Phycisphaerae bacterium]
MLEEVLALCSHAVETQAPMMIGVVNAAKIVNMRRDVLLRESVCSSDLVLADGMAVVWASRLLGQSLPERVAGIDLFESLLGVADREGWSVYFLGARQEVLENLVRAVQVRYPGVMVAGCRNGYFDEDEAESVATTIRNAQPDLLFVGMSPPKKELFLANYGRRMGVPVCHGVGGSFDVLAGKTKRAPVLWQLVGLEWFYRVLQEPSRLWRRYLVTNLVFAWLVACALVRRFLKISEGLPHGKAVPDEGLPK